MHILVVTQYYWPERFRINDLAAEFKARGHAVTVLTGLPNYPEGRYFKGFSLRSVGVSWVDGVRVVRVPVIPRGSGGHIRLALNYLSYAISATMLGPFLCRDAYDVCLVWQPSPVTVAIPALLMRWLKRLPVLLWVQDLWPESLSATGAVRSPWLLAQARRLVHFIYRRCETILIQSPKFESHILEAGIEQAQVQVLPNWAEVCYVPTRYDPELADKHRRPQGFCVMFAGNIGAAQDFETIVAAATLLADEDIHWLILGDGRRKSWLHDRITASGLTGRVHLWGAHPMETMPAYFALADAMLVALRDDPVFSRTIPSKVQSYLACARPIVAALSGAGADVVREAEAGVVVAPGDAEALAAAVRELRALPPEQRQRMGERGRAYCLRHFERDQLVDKLEQWMSEAREVGVCVS